MPQQAWTCS